MKINCIFSVVGIYGKDSYAFGINDDLIVRNSEDLRHFKELTTGHAIIMGRGTWESLGEIPLSDRKHIIVTSRDIPNKWVYSEDIIYAKTLSEALDIADTGLGSEEAFVIGGARLVIQCAMNYADSLYITYFNTKVHKHDDMSIIAQSDIESEEVRWDYALSNKNNFRSPSLVLGDEEMLDVYFLHWTRRK